jgi:sec-independent protein translocase protein TatB
MVTPPPILEANISMGDSLLLMVLALVVFGPRRLPQIGRQIGKLMYEFRKASNDFKFQMEEELRNAEEADRRKREEAERQQRLALTAQTQATEAKTETQPAQADATTAFFNASGETATTAEAPAEPSAPRILPPTTGEIVGATRAGRAQTRDSENAADRAQSTPETETSQENEAAPEETRDMTEQASRHG